MFNLEKLIVWERGVDIASIVYSATRSFPEAERCGLVNQMRRAAVSILSNIAEGSSRSSKIDFARFVEIAAGSVFELVSQAVVSKTQGFLREEEFRSIYRAAEEQSRMLSGLRRSLLES